MAAIKKNAVGVSRGGAFHFPAEAEGPYEPVLYCPNPPLARPTVPLNLRLFSNLSLRCDWQHFSVIR